MKLAKFNKKEILSLQDIKDFFKDEVSYLVKEEEKQEKIWISITKTMTPKTYYGENYGESPQTRFIDKKYYLHQPTKSHLIMAIAYLNNASGHPKYQEKEGK